MLDTKLSIILVLKSFQIKVDQAEHRAEKASDEEVKYFINICQVLLFLVCLDTKEDLRKGQEDENFDKRAGLRYIKVGNSFIYCPMPCKALS